MKHIVAIYDMDAKYYQDPRFINDMGEAVRSFINIAGDPDNPMSKNPESYCLFKVGMYDQQTGEIIPENPTKILGLWETGGQTKEEQH